MTSDINFYLTLLFRRLPVMIVIFVLCAALGVAAAITMPPRYSSSAQLLVESAQIPGDLAVSTVRIGAQERLQVIEQRLMTRRNLIDIANKHGVFDGESRMSPDQVVAAMREATRIRTTGGRDRATLMRVSFFSNDAEKSAKVVNEYVTLITADDAKRRRNLSGQTVAFFEQEVERLSQEVASKSAEILQFKEANKNALPEGLDFRLERQSTLQERVNLAARDIASYNEQRTRLMAIGVPNVAGEPGVRLSPEQVQLNQLKSELSSALAIYSESNPKVKLLNARIAQLETTIANQLSASPDIQPTTTVSADPAQAMLDLQLAEIDSRVQFLQQEVDRAKEELVELDAAIARTPQNAIRLEALEREYVNVQRLYEEAARSMNTAKTGDRIEELSQGERISVIEQPVAASEPTSPNRTLIAGGGVIAGSGLAALFFVLTELINRSIRRPVDLVRGLGVQPLATIPFIEDERIGRRRRAILTILTVGFILAIPIGLWAVHTFYLPLDLVVEKVLARLGL